MKNIKEILSYAAVIMGGVLGAGFVSGKEAVAFFGAPGAAAPIIFCAVFLVCLLTYCGFAAKNNACSAEEVNFLCFGKAATAVNVLFLTSYMIVTSTMLAGAEECMSGISETKLPVFGFLCAVAAALILKYGLNGIKKFNAAAVPVIIVFLIAVIFVKPENAVSNGDAAQPAAFYKPALYAFFNIVMSAGVLAALSRGTERKTRVSAAVISSVAVTALTVAVQIIIAKHSVFDAPLPLLKIADSGIMRIFGIIAMLLAILTSLAGNAYPLVSAVETVVGDRTVASAAVFFCALLLSFAGFDFIVSYVYPFIAAVGLVMMIFIACKTFASARRG